MGMATLAGRPFRLDPDSVQWSFSSKVADQQSVGGKVIQVYGTTISDMTITGSFGIGGWEQQELFLARMKELAQEQSHSSKQNSRSPSRFTYPPKGWDFLVYLKSYSDPSHTRAVYHAPGLTSPRWQLTLFIVEDNSGIKKVAQNTYIARLARGIGWRKTDFNGAPGDSSVYDATVGSQPGTGGGAGTATTGDSQNHGMGNQGSDVEFWRGLVAQYFPANTDQMMCIMKYESGGNRFALNQKGSSATGLFQVMASVWAEPNGIEQHHLYDAMTNVRIAKQIYDQQGYQAWPNTSRKCRNDGVI